MKSPLGTAAEATSPAATAAAAAPLTIGAPGGFGVLSELRLGRRRCREAELGRRRCRETELVVPPRGCVPHRLGLLFAFGLVRRRSLSTFHRAARSVIIVMAQMAIASCVENVQTSPSKTSTQSALCAVSV